jgi:cytochrome c oxidase subunit 4
MASRHLAGIYYVIAWIALLVLTAVSYGAARLDLAAAGPAVALGIATIKALIVLLVFMHLVEANATVRIVIGTALAFIVLLSLGIVADVAVR